MSDIVNAFVKASKSKINNEIFNVGSEHNNINKIVDLLEDIKIHIEKRPGEPDCTFADITK